MGAALWSRTILKACPASKHFILTSRISSGWTGESWKHDLGLCQLKFCRCRGLAEAAQVPVVPLWQPTKALQDLRASCVNWEGRKLSLTTRMLQMKLFEVFCLIYEIIPTQSYFLVDWCNAMVLIMDWVFSFLHSHAIRFL